VKDYYRIFSEIPDTSYEESVEHLRKALSAYLTRPIWITCCTLTALTITAMTFSAGPPG